MKEVPSAIELANDFVLKIEDQWVNERWETLDQLERRAKGSGTLIARHEFDSAKEVLTKELDRLCYEDSDPFEE